MRRLIGFLGVLAILSLLGMVGDRVAAGIAADRVEQELVREGFRSPEVVIRRFPFLTQFVDGEYRDVVVSAAGLQVEGVRAERVAATLRGVRVERINTPQEERVRRLEARATVPYSEVEQAADVPTLEIGRARGGQLRLTGEVEVLGETFTVAARGRIDANGDRLRITATGFEVEGVGDLDEQLSSLLRRRFSLDYPIPGLPRGVRLRSVTPGATGFVVDVSGRNAVLRAP
jgi:hypothetical protein